MALHAGGPMSIRRCGVVTLPGPRPRPLPNLAARYGLRIDGEMFVVALVSGELTPTLAIRSGKALIEGNRQELQRFVKLFPWNARFEMRGESASLRDR